MQRQRAAIGGPRDQPDKRRHQAHLRPGQPAPQGHPRARPLAPEAEIQGRLHDLFVIFLLGYVTKMTSEDAKDSDRITVVK